MRKTYLVAAGAALGAAALTVQTTPVHAQTFVSARHVGAPVLFDPTGLTGSASSIPSGTVAGAVLGALSGTSGSSSLTDDTCANEFVIEATSSDQSTITEQSSDQPSLSGGIIALPAGEGTVVNPAIISTPPTTSAISFAALQVFD